MSQSSRILAPDWLRGLAVLVMVECHVSNALLAPPYRHGAWYETLNWLNGLVAPAFLLVSGMMMGLNLEKRWASGTGRLWRRTGQIFIVAYLLHLPTPFLWQFFGERGSHLVELWTKMDILQCVAGSLTLLLLLKPVTQRPWIHRWVCLGLGVVAATVGALIDREAVGSSLPVWLLNYVWPTGVGKFPLVPWAGFPLIGAWLGPVVFREAKPWRQALVAGVIFVIAAQFMTGTQTYDAAFVFGRLGWVLVALAGCCFLQEPVAGTKWILQFGQLSLWSYTVHLVMVYGSCVTLGLDTLLGPKCSPMGALGWLIAVLAVTAAIVRWRAKTLQQKAAIRIMPASR